MGLKDVFGSNGDDGPQPPDRDSEPGSVSAPEDVGGRGPVTLADRTAHGGQASPDTNQAKAEPMPATAGQPDPGAALEPPSLEDMNVGGADPQAPSHPLGRPRDEPVATAPVGLVDTGVAPDAVRPVIEPDSTTKLPEGPERPAQVSEGRAQRAPGEDGVSPEQQETDVQTSAANMTPGGGPAATPSPVQSGDARGVAVPHGTPAAGTSEEAPIAQGARAPEPPAT